MQEKQLLLEIQQLRQEVQDLKQDKADLEILLETTIEHSDTVEAQLQNQAEEAVRESEKRLAQFLEAVPVGVFVVDASGQPYYANRAAQQLLGKGIAPEATVEQLAQVYQVYIAGTNQLYPNAQLPLVQALKGDSASVDDMEIHQDNRTISLDVRATPIFDEQGEIRYAIAAFQDITERKQAEKAIQEQKKQYRDIFEASGDGLIINTLDGKIAEANPAACAMHGYSHEEFIGLDPRTFIHPDYHPLFRQFIEETYQNKKTFAGQAVDICKDGTTIDVEVRGTAFTYKGKPHILAVVRDITERKQAEIKLRLAQERDRLLGEIALRIRQSLDLEETLNRTVIEVRQFLQTDRVCICYIDTNWHTKVVAESVSADFPSVIGITIDNPIFSQEMYANFEHSVRAINDLSQEEIPTLSAEILTSIEVKACLGVPITLDHPNSGNQSGFWLLVAHECSGTREWQPFEIDLLDQLGNQVAIAIQQAKLYQQLAVLNASNEASLKESEEQLRTLIDATPDVICFKDGEGRWLESNQANLVFLDLKGVDYKNKTDLELAQFSNFYHDALLNCNTTDEQAWQHGSTYRVEEIIPQPDGTISIYDIIKVPLFHPDGRRKGLVVLGRDISEIKRSEAALQASEAQYRDLVETANSIILRWDTEGNIRFLNEYGQRLFGFDALELIGNNVVGTIVPKTETSGRDLQALMVDIQKHPENYLLNENENICKNGDRVWIVWANRPIFDQQGNLVEILSVGTDVTQRRQAEEALRLSESRFRALYESNGFAVLLADNDKSLSDCNGAAEKLFGYSRQQMAGMHPGDFSPPFQPNGKESYSLADEYTALALKYGSYNSEWVHRRSDGTDFPCEVWLTGVQVGQGKFIQAIIQDLTERKQLEAELLYRAQVQSLLSSISRQFIDQDADTAINFTLRAIAQFIGVERSCIFEYSDDQTQFYLTHEWCNPGVPELPTPSRGGNITKLPWFNSQILKGKTIHFSSLAEFPPEATEKELFQHHLAQSFVAVPTNHSGKVVGFLGVDVVNFSKIWSQEDISLLKLVGELIAIGRARHKAESALRVAKEAAETANRAKSAFLANMSHELRTPLNAILGFAQLMERDDSLNSRQQESLATINRSGEHLLNLIDDVLQMSKIEAGRIVLSPAPFDLHRLLQTLQEMFLIRTQAKQLSLHFDLAPNLPQYICTDEGKLRQVLINLLSNAVKFTEVGGVMLRVKSAKTFHETFIQQETSLHFEVEDTGRGIAPEETDSLFQPFVQTTSGTQAKEGTGLGLTISRQFVQLMGGDIHLTSTKNQGSTFYFDVQVTLVEPPEAILQASNQGRVLKLAPDQPAYRILIVDDRQENRDLIQQLLQTVGFETSTANNGEEAIALWQTWHPDLIWMDMRMPVMDGYDATRRIRSLENEGSKCKIIALTASAFEEQQASILAAGCDDFVRKPFREQVLFEKMAEHLGVVYIYDQKQQAVEHKLENIQAADLTVMPAEWLAALTQAALTVDSDQILQLIEQIPQNNSTLAEGLADLVRNFCFDEILALCES